MRNAASQTPDRPRTNRLIHETSPYLLQHAHNPVDWYPWGAEAFARARAEDRPILLSVGYAACHWCHVMAHESFENADIASSMNEHFVCVKVDREERPDVDALYMEAVQALTGSGGWPMTVFLTPDGAPFYGGTYFPPADRYGMLGFPTLLRRIIALWQTRRAEVERQARAFRDFYAEQARAALPAATLEGPADTAGMALLAEAAGNLVPRFDTRLGGFGPAPKFPQAMALAFALRAIERGQSPGASAQVTAVAGQLLPLVRQTLDAMAAGGIYDQLGGGFHRYSTDAHWLVPHFEKMLYDNALLAPVYLRAWQLTGEDRYRAVSVAVLDYVLREMTDPAGGFYATQDADSEGVEGRFYAWRPAELRAALSAEDARVAERAWGVTPQGNFEGTSILHEAATAEAVAEALGLPVAEVRDALRRARERLLAARDTRIGPARDEKVLASWNGLMQRAFAEAGMAFGEPRYVAAARANATFVRAHLWREGLLLRSWRAGTIPGYLDDYAALINALLSTYEASGDLECFAFAQMLADALLARFWDDASNSFYDTAADAERLIGRPRELTDNAVPSGTSLAAEALLRLAACTGKARYREVAERVLLALAPAAARQPLAFGHLLCAFDDLVGPFLEVAIVGPADDPATEALRATVAARYRPRLALAVAAPDDAASRRVVPLLADRGLVAGAPAAYVCRDFVCRQPVTNATALARALAEP